MVEGVRHHYVAATDGLLLHAVICGDVASARLPVVCLPGLTRSARDFAVLARRLAGDRCVVCLDYRGRGRSAYDANWRNYNMDVEGDDILHLLATLGIARVILVGTSRGGLHALRFAARAPDLVAAAVLNDIGPVIELAGLRRIRGYVGQGAPPRTLAESIAAAKATADGRFPALDEDDWAAVADTTFGDGAGAYGARYDPLLARTLESLDLDRPQPTQWPLFEALCARPVLAIRGALSDLLAPDTFERMSERCQTLVVEGQGHAPLLIDQPTLATIADFVQRQS